MSEEQINSSCNFIANNLLYNAYQKLEFSKLIGKKITGILVGHENAFICMKDSRGKKYVLYIFYNEDTGLPDYIIFNQNSGLRCFQMKLCWNKREYRKWLRQVRYAVKTWRKRITKKVKEKSDKNDK